jgi:hypothetical protein
MTIDDQENRPLGIVNQTDEKVHKHFRSHPALGDHKAHLPAWIAGRYVGKPKACSCGGYAGLLAALGPCGVAIVRAHAGLIGKLDVRLGLACQCFDLGKFFLQPLLHRLRVLLVGTPHRPMRAQPQLVQQPADRPETKVNTVFLLNQRCHHSARLQRREIFQVQRVFAGNRVVEPVQCRTAEFTRPATAFSGIQRIPFALPVAGQPPAKRLTRYIQYAGDHLRALTGLHRMNCTLSQIRQLFVGQPSRILLFHAAFLAR